MSSGSDLSWCTADEITEYSNLTSNINEICKCNCDANLDKSAKLLPNSDNSNEIISIKTKNQPIHGAQKNVKLLQWIKESYTLKIPWILLIFSIIQVMQ